MKILSWNVAGLRARLKIKDNYTSSLEQALFSQINKNGEGYQHFDIICLQETKCTPNQVKLPSEIDIRYPYRFWNSNPGTTQRTGFSGTAIWSNIKPIKQMDTPEFDTEGRITCIEFEDFYLLTVYTPNSQDATSERCNFRINIWDPKFREYIINLNKIKNTIICGDFNVAHKEIDIYNPIKYKNAVAGFLDSERDQFTKHLESGFTDILRLKNKEANLYTYWNQRAPQMRKTNRGWRIDYFIINNKFCEKIKNANIHPEIMGSDHCPISIEL